MIALSANRNVCRSIVRFSSLSQKHQEHFDSSPISIMPKQKYVHKITEGCPYEQTYNCSNRTIQRYSRLGYPLDDTQATLALIAAQKLQPPGRQEPQPVADRADDGRRNAQEARTAALGMAGSIDRLQQAEAAAHRHFLNAATDAEKLVRGKARTALAEQLRKQEQATPEIEESNKQTVKLSDIKQTLSELFHKLRQDLDTMPKRIALELIGKDEIGCRLVLETEIAQIVNSLYQNKYLEQK